MGRIVIVSSTSRKAPKSFLSLSAATRSAVWAWAKSVAPELYGFGVTMNAVFAGPHKTDRAKQLNVRADGIGLPEDFGTLVATMCGDATRFMIAPNEVQRAVPAQWGIEMLQENGADTSSALELFLERIAKAVRDAS